MKDKGREGKKGNKWQLPEISRRLKKLMELRNGKNRLDIRNVKW